MFYEEADIKNELVCAKCKLEFSESKNQPRVLTCCGETICTNCSLQLRDIFDNQFSLVKCDLCHSFVDKPFSKKDGLFDVNKLAVRLLKKTAKDVYRGKFLERFKELIKQFCMELQCLKMFTETSDLDMIKHHCEKLRSEINLITQNSLIKLDISNMMLKDQLNEYEKESIERLKLIQNESSDYGTNETSRKNESKDLFYKMSNFINNWNDYMKKAQIDEDHISRSFQDVYDNYFLMYKSILKLASFSFNGKFMLFEFKDNRSAEDLIDSPNILTETEENNLINLNITFRLFYSNIRYIQLDKLRLDQLKHLDLNPLLINRNKMFPVKIIKLNRLNQMLLIFTDSEVNYLTHLLVVNINEFTKASPSLSSISASPEYIQNKFSLNEFVSIVRSTSDNEILLQTDIYEHNKNRYFLKLMSVEIQDKLSENCSYRIIHKQYIGEYGYSQVEVGSKYIYALSKKQYHFDIYDFDLKLIKTIKSTSSSALDSMNPNRHEANIPIASAIEFFIKSEKIYFRRPTEFVVLDEKSFERVNLDLSDLNAYLIKLTTDTTNTNQNNLPNIRCNFNYLINSEEKIFIFANGKLTVFHLMKNFLEDKMKYNLVHEIDFVDFDLKQRQMTNRNLSKNAESFYNCYSMLLDQSEDILIIDQNFNKLIYLE